MHIPLYVFEDLEIGEIQNKKLKCSHNTTFVSPLKNLDPMSE